MISVCITTFNGEKFIEEQVLSILSQLNIKDEIIVSDDGSKDNTINILSNIKDKRLKIISNDKANIGPKHKYSFAKITNNFTNALTIAKGDIIFLADQDDIWLPNKVETVCQLFDNNPTATLVIHDCTVIDQHKNILHKSYFNLNQSSKGFIKNIINCSYLGCCMAFKKELLDQSTPIPSNVPHDIWLGLIAEWNTNVIFCHTPLLLYRRHTQNQSTSSEKSRLKLKDKVAYRLTLVKELVKFWLIKRQ